MEDWLERPLWSRPQDRELDGRRRLPLPAKAPPCGRRISTAQTLDTLAAEQPQIVCRELNVRNPKEIEQLAAQLPEPHILFNCAGYVHHGTILDCKEEDWEFSFDLNVRSMYRTCRAFLPGMLRAGRGSIVNMASIASSVRGVPNRFVYTSSKAAVVGLTKAIAIDFVRQGIRCNAICPGTVQSPSLDGRIAAQGDAEQVRREFIARQPMGRLGRPEEVAALARVSGIG